MLPLFYEVNNMYLSELIPYLDYTTLLRLLDVNNNVIAEYDLINQLVNDTMLDVDFVYRSIIPVDFRDMLVLHIMAMDTNRIDVILSVTGGDFIEEK